MHMLHRIRRHKHAVIPVVIIGLVVSLFLAIALFWIAGFAKNRLVETGPENACVQDSECWCRRFDGAKFLPGTNQSMCDPLLNTCVRCYYY